jgi:hypothetical protein
VPGHQQGGSDGLAGGVIGQAPIPCRAESPQTDQESRSISVALRLAEANPRSVVTINVSSWLANST